MVNGSAYKFSSLDHAESLITRPVISFVHIRLTVALLLALIGAVGLKFIGWRSERKTRRGASGIINEV
jgi:hypothetical protein